ncbi:DUF1127 domain-containing protein [Rhizobium sp. CF142]|uniref:DUF1127 domain-containing protein n=1 Tax=Rhizobium sp. CF142 TaxID=1144314 RepID=UPI00026EE9AC|nr:DUF1127 domain-containing protein [Rhizobium sp. CF142]EJJ29729.1 Protein of unknown function (DUF1127) [Rhizobium sp. CF142]
MAHTETHAAVGAPIKQVSEYTVNSITMLAAAVRQWRRVVARRKVLADLTPDQLRDIGQPEINRPVLEIKAGLMTNLMSMR